MEGSFCRQFSIAVCPLAWSPAVSWLQTTWELVARSVAVWSTWAAPKPFRKPLWRSTPTEMPGARSRVAILTVLPALAALAYWPISTPALKLSVANSASVASCGWVGVSSAITSTPALRAFWIAGTIALVSLGVMRMPLTPPATMFSMAVTWLALSPSNLPAAVSRLGVLAWASFSAPSFILTKNGLVSVLVMSPTWAWPPPPPPPPPLSLRPEQPAASSASETPAITSAARHDRYVEGLAAEGIALDPHLVVMDLRGVDAARDAAAGLLAAAEPPTALLTGQNLITIGAIHALQRLGPRPQRRRQQHAQRQRQDPELQRRRQRDRLAVDPGGQLGERGVDAQAGAGPLRPRGPGAEPADGHGGAQARERR